MARLCSLPNIVNVNVPSICFDDYEELERFFSEDGRDDIYEVVYEDRYSLTNTRFYVARKDRMTEYYTKNETNMVEKEIN